PIDVPRRHQTTRDSFLNRASPGPRLLISQQRHRSNRSWTMAGLTGTLQDGSDILAECDRGGLYRLVGIRAERRGLRHTCNGYNEKDRKAYPHGALLKWAIPKVSRCPVVEQYTPMAHRLALTRNAMPEPAV